MDRLLDTVSERESGLVNLADQHEQSKIGSLLNNLPNYANSRVWQDMIKQKALQKQ